MTQTWPLQKDCDRYYGNPRGSNGQPSAKWESANLVSVRPPFRMTYAGKPISGIRVHKKCAESLQRILAALWEASGRSQARIDEWGVSIYGGAYNYRLMRGGNSLSMHSWGCAIDLDPARNGLGDTTPRFRQFPEVLRAFADEGWEWGGDWSRPDGMHWQAAWTRAGAVRPGEVPVQKKPATPEYLSEKYLTAAAVTASAVSDELARRDADERRKIVSRVQQLLNDKGWPEVGLIDGDLGERTQGAILSFRNQHKPPLLPLTPTVDDSLVAALEAYGSRPVSLKRATATAEDLKKAGDPTMGTVDTIKKTVTGGGLFALLGAVDQEGKIDSAKRAVEGVSAWREMAEQALNAVQWAAQRWPIFVILLAGYLMWRLWDLQRIRVQDHRAGRNVTL